MPEMPTTEEKIALFIDGQLDPKDADIVETELAANSDLRKLQSDLKLLKQTADQLEIPPLDPNLRVKLQAKIDRRYTQQSRRLLWWLLPQAALALALALWFFIPKAPHPDALSQTLAQVNAAQQSYHQAILQLEQLAVNRLEEFPPDTALLLSKNLHIINQAIADCESLVRQYPTNREAYASLSHAYQQKMNLLQHIMGVKTA